MFLSLAIFAIAFTSCKSKKLTKQQQRSDLQDTYETLKREMAEAKVTMEGESVKVVLPEAVLFKVNSAELNTEYFPILKKMATVLNKYPKTTIVVSGYTDISGTETLNKELSQKRAENAKQIMMTNGVKENRLNTWGFGSKNPIADNKTEEGRKQNRRVEFVIMYDNKEEKK